MPGMGPRRRTGSVNPYAAGNRLYQGAVSSPNNGAVRNLTGYRERDIRAQAQKRALQQQYKNYYQGRY